MAPEGIKKNFHFFWVGGLRGISTPLLFNDSVYQFEQPSYIFKKWKRLVILLLILGFWGDTWAQNFLFSGLYNDL